MKARSWKERGRTEVGGQRRCGDSAALRSLGRASMTPSQAFLRSFNERHLQTQAGDW